VIENAMNKITISRETAQTIYDIYVETDDLYAAAPTTIKAVRELAAALGAEHKFYKAPVVQLIKRP
jgi:hypothetical protein